MERERVSSNGKQPDIVLLKNEDFALEDLAPEWERQGCLLVGTKVAVRGSLIYLTPHAIPITYSFTLADR